MTAEYGTLQASNVVYALADAGVGAFYYSSTNTFVGTQLVSGTYYSYLSYVTFDLSNLPADTTHVYFVGFWNPQYGGVPDGDIVLNIASYDYGTTLEAADWRNSTQLSALTPLATLSSVGIGSGGEHFSFEIPIGSLNMTGVNRFILYLDVQADATPPTDTYMTIVAGPNLTVKREYSDPGSTTDYRTEVLADSPVINWRLDETSGTNADDSSGNNNDGTYVNSPTLGEPSLLASDLGTAVEFAQSSDNYVESTNTFSAGEVFTGGLAFECLVNTDPPNHESFYSVPVGFEQGNEIDIELYNASGPLATTKYFISFYYQGAPPGQWTEFLVGEFGTTHHIIAQYDGVSQNVIYIDGDAYWYVKPGEAQIYDPPELNAEANNLYAGGDSFTDSVDGVVDEVSYYDVALTDERARIHFKAASEASGNNPSLTDTVGISASFAFHLANWRVSLTDTVGVTASLSVSVNGSYFLNDTVGVTASLSASVATFGPYAAAVLADSPTIYYRLGETSGTTAVAKVGTDGTYVGSPTLGVTSLIQGTSDTAVTFSRTGPKYMNGGLSLPASTAYGTFAVEGVFKPTTLFGGQSQIVFGPRDAQVVLFGSPATIRFNYNGNPGAVISPATTYTAGVTYHVIGEWDGTNANLYINGVLAVSTPRAAGLTLQGGPDGLNVGSSSASLSFEGVVDDIVFYDHHLGATRAAVHYAAVNGNILLSDSLSDSVGISGSLSVSTTSVYPHVTSVSPISGTTLGGTSVNITGTFLSGATAVVFGATAAASFVVNSSTSITAVTPAHAEGLVDIRVTTPTGTTAIESGDEFTFVPPAPLISLISPDSGPTAGGTSVEISGTRMSSVTTVRFGTVDAASFVINSDVSITAVTPAHAAGPANVTVTNVSGTSLPEVFTFDALPAIATAVPSSGTTSGGTSVAINGSQFTGATAVYFGATPATSFVVNSDVLITAVTPPHSPGTVAVRVTTPSGTNP